MGAGSWILIGIAAAGLLGRNLLVATAAFVTLLLATTASDQLWRLLGDQAIRFGILLLLLGVLVPFGSGQLTWETLRTSLSSLEGVVAVFTGLMSAWLGARGLALLQVSPELIVGFVVGSVIGVMFFAGIPAGPLVAFGLAALILDLLR